MRFYLQFCWHYDLLMVESGWQKQMPYLAQLRDFFEASPSLGDDFPWFGQERSIAAKGQERGEKQPEATRSPKRSIKIPNKEMPSTKRSVGLKMTVITTQTYQKQIHKSIITQPPDPCLENNMKERYEHTIIRWIQTSSQNNQKPKMCR